MILLKKIFIFLERSSSFVYPKYVFEFLRISYSRSNVLSNSLKTFIKSPGTKFWVPLGYFVFKYPTKFF
jgi:hypothetical protein